MQRVIENPRSGERIVIRQSAADTAGELLVFDVFLPPGGHVPAGHVHPRQEERFSVLAGQVRFRMGRRTVVAETGATLTVERGVTHWFGNIGSGVAQLRVEVRPALRLEALFESSGRRGSFLDWLLIPLDYQRELSVPNVPAWLVIAVLTPLAWLRHAVAL